MAGIGEGFGQGLTLGMAARDRKKQREADQARLVLEAQRQKEVLQNQKELQKEKLTEDAKRDAANQLFHKELAAQQGTQRMAEQDRALAADAARQAAQLKQRGDEVALNQIGNSIGGFQKFVASTAPKPEYVTLEQPIDPDNPNAGKTTRRMLASSFGQMPQPKPAETYQSPYAKEITDAEAQIAEQTSQLSEDDEHDGLGTNRNKIRQEQTNRMLNLKAHELRDKVLKGLITEEQAEAEAQRLKKAWGVK